VIAAAFIGGHLAKFFYSPGAWRMVTIEPNFLFRILDQFPGRPISRRHGADDLRLESDGSLSALADKRKLSWKKPALYQVGVHGQKIGIEGRFRFSPDGTVGFEVGVYDITRPLVIDPVLTYATYFGTRMPTALPASQPTHRGMHTSSAARTLPRFR